MATKAEILDNVKLMAKLQLITKNELITAFEAGSQPEDAVSPAAAKKRFGKIGIAEILYYLGGGIIFLGIVVLVAQNWSHLGFGAKVLATLGAGVAAYYSGLMFSRDERTEVAAPVFFMISALVIPVGLFVVMDNAGIKSSSYGYQTIIAAILLLGYFVSYFLFHRTIFVLFSVLYGTWLFFSITSYLFISGPRFDEAKFYLYRAFIAGLAYLFLGRGFEETEFDSLTGFLKQVGIVAFLGAALALGGWKPSQTVFWELIYPGLVFGTIFLSVHIRSKAFLAWGTIFLMLYLLKLTAEYFSRGFGWPFALVMAGFALIGVGYMSISIRRNYLTL